MAEQHVLLALRSGSQDAGYAAARLVAQGWHGGSDHNITALSHRHEWSTDGLIEEIDQLLARNLPQGTPAEKKAADEELRALKEWARGTWINAFWSTFGHEQADDSNGCMYCGGRWELVHDSPTDIRHGRYRNGAGEDPTECARISVTHGEAECSTARRARAAPTSATATSAAKD
jgi:hypothetical protein